MNPRNSRSGESEDEDRGFTRTPVWRLVDRRQSDPNQAIAQTGHVFAGIALTCARC